MAKLSVESFLDYLRKSELTDEARLEAALEKIRASANPENVSDAEYIASELVKEGLITNWHVRQLMKKKYKGFYLRQYRILGHLGTGGMSTVYLAEHTLMQRRVAIKVLPKKRLTNSVYLDRFIREAQAIASLDHPHIVRAYDIDRYDDIHYIVMEYFEGNNLRQIVEKEGPLPYEDAVNDIRQAAEALIHAHRIGIIHRDVKPENILVNDKGMAKLLDLGLALLDEAVFNQPLSSIDEDKILGTADYLAPEQAIDSHKVDGRADIYSLGCTLYFCLTGHAPFPFGTIPQRLMAHQRENPASIFIDRPDAPNDLVDICNKMMSKKVSERYQTAGEIVQVLSRWLIRHGFAEPQDFPSASSSETLPGLNPDATVDGEEGSHEFSFLRDEGNATLLGGRHDQWEGGSEFSSGIGNEVVVNLLGSEIGSQSGAGSASKAREQFLGDLDPKEILLSKNARVPSQQTGFDPLALAMDEIETGRTDTAARSAGSPSSPGKGEPVRESAIADDTGRFRTNNAGRPAAIGGSHVTLVPDDADASTGRIPFDRVASNRNEKNSPPRGNPTASIRTEKRPTADPGTEKMGLKSLPVAATKNAVTGRLGDWYRKVPFWFWALFFAGYVLATFFAGILVALLGNLGK